MEKDQQFLVSIVSGLVEYPEQVTTERIVDEKGVLITLKVNPQDMGRVIGKKGILAAALRTIIRAYGAKNSAAVHLKIFDPRGDHMSDKELLEN